MKILYVHADQPSELNSANWRCNIPAKAINESGLAKADVIFFDQYTRNNPLAAEANIIIYQRYCWGEATQLAKHFQKEGKKIVYDFDDHYEGLPDSIPSYEFWTKGRVKNSITGIYDQMMPTPISNFRRIRKIVDLVTVSSPWLANEYDATLVPNWPDEDLYPKELVYPKRSGNLIGWGGSASHFEGWDDMPILEALKEVNKQRKVKVRIHCMDGRIPHMIERKIGTRVQNKMWMPIEMYFKHQAEFDFVIIPLSDMDYDKARSPIKAYDAMMMGIPWITNKIDGFTPYEDVKQFGHILDANFAKLWEKELLDMIDNKPKEREAARLARNWARENLSIHKNIEKILQTYEDLL